MHLDDELGQLGIADCPVARRTARPGVETRSGTPRGSGTAASRHRRHGGRRRTESGSPGRLLSEIGGCLAQDLAFEPQLRHLGAQPAQLGPFGLAHRARVCRLGSGPTFRARPNRPASCDAPPAPERSQPTAGPSSRPDERPHAGTRAGTSTVSPTGTPSCEPQQRLTIRCPRDRGKTNEPEIQLQPTAQCPGHARRPGAVYTEGNRECRGGLHGREP